LIDDYATLRGAKQRKERDFVNIGIQLTARVTKRTVVGDKQVRLLTRAVSRAFLALFSRRAALRNHPLTLNRVLDNTVRLYNLPQV